MRSIAVKPRRRGFAGPAPVLQTAGMSPALIVLVVAALAASGIWLAWSVVRRSQRRQRAIHDLLNAADALEASLRTARGEIEAIAGDHVNPVRAAMQDLLRQRMWLQEHGQRASLQQLAEVRASLDAARDSLQRQLQRVAQARAPGA